TDVDLARELSGIVDAPIHLINDADAEAIADSTATVTAIDEPGADDFGASQLFVSLSTGVGAAVIIDGVVVAGASHRAGEIGHVPVLFGP
ncbi:ROK family protein, partial [Priestia sp. SIMBA_032]